jgi:hypothetical protein
VSFSLDTSAILDAWVRHYPPDVFPSIWERMKGAASEGKIFIIDEVLSELKRKDDGAHEWFESHGEMVISIDAKIQASVAEIMHKYPKIIDTRRNRSGCDPWVVALAQVRGFSVVTAERPSGSLARPKIPDICVDMALPHMDVVEFFRRQGWRI